LDNTKGPKRISDRIEEIQRELSMMEDLYEIAIRRLKGEDHEWNEKRKFIIDRIMRLLKTYKIGDTAEKCIGICAECSTLARELTGPENCVAQYKEAKQLLAAAQREAEARRNSEEAYNREMEKMGRRAV
jgi:hypothetical protein